MEPGRADSGWAALRLGRLSLRQGRGAGERQELRSLYPGLSGGPSPSPTCPARRGAEHVSRSSASASPCTSVYVQTAPRAPSSPSPDATWTSISAPPSSVSVALKPPGRDRQRGAARVAAPSPRPSAGRRGRSGAFARSEVPRGDELTRHLHESVTSES